eukprot:925036-Alexandrium_andersonii.AAC.1
MQEVSSELEDCYTAKNLSDFMKDFNRPKPAFNDLKAAARKIAGKLEASLKAAEKERSKRKALQKKGSGEALGPSLGGGESAGPVT